MVLKAATNIFHPNFQSNIMQVNIIAISQELSFSKNFVATGGDKKLFTTFLRYLNVGIKTSN